MCIKYKVMNKITISVLTTFVLIIASCGSNNKSAEINAVFTGMKNKTFILEEILPNNMQFLDSIKTNTRGKFSYTYEFKDDNPVFIRIFLSESDHLTLLITPGEEVTVSSIVNLARNYTVEGSQGSSLVRDLNQSVLDTYHKVEQLHTTYHATTISEQKRDIERQWGKLYLAQKKNSINFLVHNSNSLSSIVALYQHYSNGLEVFNEKNDFQYNIMITDSLTKYFPTSPHVKLLIKNVENRNSSISRLEDLIKNEETIPDIDLPDIYGANKKLNSIKDKTILLTFWRSDDPNSGMVNRELKDLYAKMKDSDFEIYQVSLDDNKMQWISSIIDQGIPWVSVRDEAALRSIAARVYQIKTVPFNYLISKNGDIEAKNIWGNDLMNKVKELTKQK